MIYGYVRVSTAKQNVDRQIRNIKSEYETAIIFQDVYTGSKMERPGWERLMSRVKPGDVIVFDSVGCMSRNAAAGFEVYETLYQTGIELMFLKEPHINTDVFRDAVKQEIPMTGTDVDLILEGVNRYLMAVAKKQIQLAFEQAEKEVEDIRQRTKEGIETARLNGKQIGRPEGFRPVTKKSIRAKEIILKHSKSFNGTLNDTEVILLAGVSRRVYYKYKRELKEERERGCLTAAATYETGAVE